MKAVVRFRSNRMLSVRSDADYHTNDVGWSSPGLILSIPQGIAINLADSQPPTLLVVTAKDLGKRPLDLGIGDTILWRGDDMRIRNEEEGMILISPGMKGKVITRSENLLADAARKAGLPIDAPVTHFSQGRRALVR